MDLRARAKIPTVSKDLENMLTTWIPVHGYLAAGLSQLAPVQRLELCHLNGQSTLFGTAHLKARSRGTVIGEVAIMLQVDPPAFKMSIGIIF